MTRDFETLVFCTSYIAGQGEWVARYERWLNHHAVLPFDRALFCMIDDASPYLPDQGKVQIIEVGQPFPTPPARPLMFRFRNRLGRSAVDNYPGWRRSFLFSVLVAKNYRCRKVCGTRASLHRHSQRPSRQPLRRIQDEDSRLCRFRDAGLASPQSLVQIDEYRTQQCMRRTLYSSYPGPAAG